MIQINVLSEAGSIFGQSSRSEDTGSKKSKQTGLAVLLAFVLFVALFYAYCLFAGIPSVVAPYMPQGVVASLGLVPAESSPIASQPQVAEVPADAATKPVTPTGNAVEEVVSTMRPDLFYMKERKEYRELLPAEKILHQKAFMAAAFATFRTITPPIFGFTDLSFKIPDFYYSRGLASDGKSMRGYLDSLRKHSVEFTEVPQPEGQKTLEFTAYGRLSLPEATPGERLMLLTASQVVQEMTDLNNLAVSHQIKFTGLDNPKVTNHGLYRRVLYRAQTKADFPAMQQFTEALQASNLRVGILQVSMRPSLGEGTATVFDFVVYTAPQ